MTTPFSATMKAMSNELVSVCGVRPNASRLSPWFAAPENAAGAPDQSAGVRYSETTADSPRSDR
jgi:hypothetical protein